MKNNQGISLIVLIITIVIVIILASIVIQTTSDVPDKAQYTKYMQVMKNVQVGVDNAKIENARKGMTENKLMAGFKKVYLEKAPSEFVSFGEIYDPVTGYLVNLEKIDYGDAEFGHGYLAYFSGDEIPTITFGSSSGDAYVIDADWQVYYIKGLNYDGSMNYSIK